MGGVAYLSLEDSEVCHVLWWMGLLLIVDLFILLGAVQWWD